jgi:hypothetical protein
MEQLALRCVPVAVVLISASGGIREGIATADSPRLLSALAVVGVALITVALAPSRTLFARRPLLALIALALCLGMASFASMGLAAMLEDVIRGW